MKTGVEQLTQYAAYHRDKRNIATHFVGIPLIVFAVLILASRLHFVTVNGVPISLALVLWALSSFYYLKLDMGIGVLMTVLHLALLWLAAPLAQGSVALWLASGIGIFVFGWVLQFIGHHFEGKKPAFVDDLIGLVVGPMFVVTEFLFLLGLRKPLQNQIEAKVGPTLIRGQGSAA
jgi:uncharacterized membrane protein YGL010W